MLGRRPKQIRYFPLKSRNTRCAEIIGINFRSFLAQRPIAQDSSSAFLPSFFFFWGGVARRIVDVAIFNSPFSCLLDSHIPSLELTACVLCLRVSKQWQGRQQVMSHGSRLILNISTLVAEWEMAHTHTHWRTNCDRP